MISFDILSSLHRYKMLSKRVKKSLAKNSELSYRYARDIIRRGRTLSDEEFRYMESI